MSAEKCPRWRTSTKPRRNRVKGCQATVWLKEAVTDGSPPRLRFAADSNSQIVKGLVAILLILYSNKTPEEIRAIDAKATLARLDLESHLSPHAQDRAPRDDPTDSNARRSRRGGALTPPQSRRPPGSPARQSRTARSAIRLTERSPKLPETSKKEKDASALFSMTNWLKANAAIGKSIASAK